MSAKKKQSKEKPSSAFESPEVLAEQLTKTEQFLEEHKNLVLTVLAVLFLGVAGFFGYRYYLNQQNKIAQDNIFQAIYYFESDSLESALNGDGNNLGFLAIIEDYRNTETGNLANFYAGVSYLKLGRYALAIEYLEDFSSSDLLVQARAYSLIGDANMELGFYEDAVEYYNKAVAYKPNEQFTPQYLVKAAIAYEKLDDLENAKRCYDEIVDKYKEASNYQEAQKQKARLEEILN